MGVQNRQRRAAAKAKRRAKDRSRRHTTGWRPGDARTTSSASPRELVDRLIELAVGAELDDDDEVRAAATARLTLEDAGLVDAECAATLRRLVVVLWQHGWQPAEVVRHCRRSDAVAGRLARAVVIADHADSAPSTLDPRWVAQVDELRAGGDSGIGQWLAAFARREELDRPALVAAALHVAAILSGVGPLPTVVPPPGAGPAEPRRHSSAVDDPVLVRVRALLAQAESTTFEAEAEAFTAKAQALMARHTIDAAVVWARSDRQERPITVRLPIDDPYADIKSLLLQYVARHSRCTAVHHPRYGLQSVVGFESDVASADVLFTSLLVQAQAALLAEAAKAIPGSRPRSRSFRSSFLLSFTHRIDERLAEINATVEAAVSLNDDGGLLPALADRGGAVDATVEDLFGALVSNEVRGGADAAGWARGRVAADLARLSAGDLEGSGA